MSEYDSPRGYNPQDRGRYGRADGSSYNRRYQDNPRRNPPTGRYDDARPYPGANSGGANANMNAGPSGQYRARMYEANQPHPGSPGYGRPRNAGMPQPSTGRRGSNIVPPYPRSTDNLHLAGSGRYDHVPDRGEGSTGESGRRNMNRQMVGTPLRQSTRDRYDRQRPRTYESYSEERRRQAERPYEEEPPAPRGRSRIDASDLRRSGHGGYEVDYAYDPAISQRRRENHGTTRRRPAPGGGRAGGIDGMGSSIGGFFANFGGRLVNGASSLFGRLCDLPQPVLIGGIAALALLIIVLFAVSSQPAEIPTQDSSQVAAENSESASSSSGSQEVVMLSAGDVIKSLTKAGVDADLAKKAGTLSESDNRIAQIAANASAYNVDGETVQRKLLELSINEPEAIDFVLNWPDKYPAKKAEAYSDEVTQGTIPRLYQWDQRWGFTEYSGTTFALTGCCPTSLSMVYMGLTGNNDKSPYDLAKLAKKDGYMTDLDGTVANFLTEDADKLGLKCKQLDLTESALKKALDGGAAVICNVGPGDFTQNGHYFVVTGFDENGKLTINDPYSAVRSEKRWSTKKILGQTVALYSFTAA